MLTKPTLCFHWIRRLLILVLQWIRTGFEGIGLDFGFSGTGSVLLWIRIQGLQDINFSEDTGIFYLTAFCI
jgi:hypothetical protein